MGIESDRFVYGVPQDAHCFLCCLVLEDPIEIVECGHYFCNKCLEDWKENNSCEENSTCPYCGILIQTTLLRKSKLLWNLIQNMNVHCMYKTDGCEVVYKYGFNDLHKNECMFEKRKNENNNESRIDKCPTCRVNLNEDINTHDCMKELISQLKEKSSLITNLEHENHRLMFKLNTCEKQYLEEKTEIEGQFYVDSLRYNKEIRDLRTRLAHFQGELGAHTGKNEQEEIAVNLERLNGSLGFNIIGGASKNGESSGIFVSRISEEGAAHQPGKLMLHDRILEVDGIDLREATHELAVNTFRASGNPVKMVVRRPTRKTRASDVSTQTQVIFETGKREEVFADSPTKRGWFDPMSLAADLSSNDKSEYDSAYDTLNKSSRHSQQQTPVVTDQSDLESTNTEGTIAADNPSSFKEHATPTNQSLEKTCSTYFVIPDKEDFNVSLASPVEGETEFEFEYEEVLLRKRSGKFGVLLCYGGNESDVAVYVGDVEENSDADVSGKIMVGDQIVQINGCQVSDVEQAYRMFEENEVITLVVARGVYDNQTDYYDEAEETDLDMLDCIAEENEFQSKTSSPTYASSASSSKSSEKARSPEISPIKLQRVRSRALSPSDSSMPDDAPVRRERSSSSNMDDAFESKKQDSSSKTEKETKKSSLKNFMKNKLGGQKDKRTGSHSDDSCDFTKLPRCDSNSSTNSNKSQKSKESTNVSSSRNNNELLKTRLKEQRQQSKLKAYMDSPSLSRHNNNKINQQHVSLFQAPYMINSGPQVPFTYHGVTSMQPMFTNRPPQLTPTPPVTSSLANRNSMMTASVSSLRSALKNSQINNGRPMEKRTAKRVQIDPHPGWNDTEKRVWEEFKIIQSMEKENGESKIENAAAGNVEAEWRVRRSKDGKHIYIKKTNSSRSKVLKDRAQQINDERCGVTTDDDAFTVYQGQYWNRDQRKKQLIRHNERRKRLVQKAELKASYENKTKKEMAELVQRNMTIPVFDNFITIEEILSQRNRSGVFAGPIHVTTI